MDEIFEKIHWVGILIVVVAVIIAFADTYDNTTSEITEGVVIDKTVRGTHAPIYELTIQGEKNGKIVEYDFGVTPATYDAYNIGDYYSETR